MRDADFWLHEEVSEDNLVEALFKGLCLFEGNPYIKFTHGWNTDSEAFVVGIIEELGQYR